MSSKHSRKYFQKYHIFLSLTIIMALFYACTTNKVPKGQYLLTKNNFKFTDGSVYSSGVSDYVSQKPNGKTLL